MTININSTPEEMYALGMRYWIGEGVERNLEESAKWVRKAAEAGVVDAQAQWAFQLHTGSGIARNSAEAATWAQRAAKSGNTCAMNLMGVLLQTGSGIEPNIANAVEWYRKAADGGYPSGMYNLGLCYKNGLGLEKNDTKACALFRKAAEMGDKDSLAKLEELGLDIRPSTFLLRSILKRKNSLPLVITIISMMLIAFDVSSLIYGRSTLLMNQCKETTRLGGKPCCVCGRPGELVAYVGSLSHAVHHRTYCAEHRWKAPTEVSGGMFFDSDSPQSRSLVARISSSLSILLAIACTFLGFTFRDDGEKGYIPVFGLLVLSLMFCVAGAIV